MMINAPASTPVRHLRAQGPRPSRTLKTAAFDDDENDNFGHDNDDAKCQRQFCQNFWILNSQLISQQEGWRLEALPGTW